MAEVFLEYIKGGINQDYKIREEATVKIQELLKQEGSLLLLTSIVGSSQIDITMRQMAAILFKNHIKLHWVNDDNNECTISRKDKDAIKQGIVSLTLSVTPNLQSQLTEALSFIGESEFPSDWPALLPELIEKMRSPDYNTVNTVLQATNALFKKYRHQMKSNQILLQLKYILLLFPSPYLELFVKVGQQIKESANNPAQLVVLFNCLLSLLEIFLSLSSVDLPEFFEDNLAQFSTEFLNYLQYKTEVKELIESKNDEDPTLLNKVHTVICEILNLYTQLYDDEFSNYLQPFVGSVWNLLSKVSGENNTVANDILINSSLKFLSTVSMSIQHSIFQSPETLQQICSRVVTPNIQLKETDLELYEDNPTEYMRRDIEGSDADTRRRSSIELVKGLRKYFEQQVTQLLSVDINNLLQRYNTNPNENWLDKDSAIFLVTALAVKKDNNAASNSLVPVVDFFRDQIAPELQKASSNKPILVADCLKFITIFRNQLPVEYYPQLLNLVISCLSNPDYVIHTYASTCIDHLLQVKDNGVPRVSLDYIQSNLGNILLPLVKVFEFPCSRANERTMRPVARIVLQMIGRIDKGTSIQLLEKFTQITLNEAANPSNHAFNHYCFEVIGSLLKSIVATAPESFNLVMPLVQFVLQKDVQEFAPYTFQLLAILVENANTENFGPYREIFPPFYHPNLWKRNANVPALTRLLQAYFKRDGDYIVQAGHLQNILGVFQNLISSPANDHEGFFLLETIVETLKYEQYEPFIVNIFSVILARITSHKTDKIVRCFIVFLGVFIYKIGVAKAITICNTVKDGLWAVIIEKLWIVACQKVTGAIEKKIISVGMTLMLCSPEMYQSLKQPWIHIAARQYQMLSNKEAPAPTAAEEEPANYIETEQPDGYVPTFTQLQFTKKQDSDPIPQVQDAQKYFKDNFKPIYAAHQSAIDQLIAGAGCNFDSILY